MRFFAFLVAILPVSCSVIPLSQVEDPTTELSLDVAPVELDDTPAVGRPLNTSLVTIGPRNLVRRVVLPPCPAGQTFDRSICYTSHVISRYCKTNPPSANGERKEAYCADDEVCVQRNLANGLPFADCFKIRDLVQWRTDPDANKEGCTRVGSRGQNLGARRVGTIVYDVNQKPIQVRTIRFTGEPGDRDSGIGATTSYALSSSWVFDATQFMVGKYKVFSILILTDQSIVCIASGGYTNLKAYTWFAL
ncbi:hypothetical protein CTRI78_v011322 [Colletotrichum trifolii]|uniref:Secreted in xylem 6 n=1 Tax=Colletotrichum trifolii TaxID=5466 RepID=A0A4R8QCM5_COLTR|nr:hypothetical protein CTRI78_v011322 [Colletotrichum trifolii]